MIPQAGEIWLVEEREISCADCAAESASSRFIYFNAPLSLGAVSADERIDGSFYRGHLQVRSFRELPDGRVGLRCGPGRHRNACTNVAPLIVAMQLVRANFMPARFA